MKVQLTTERRNDMRIAVTFEHGEIFQHFGHTEQFKVYEVEDGEIKASEIVATQGSGHSALAGMLAEMEVEVLICGGIGAGARTALEAAGIKLYGGASGDADAAVAALLAGTLAYNPEVRCGHHDSKEGHHGHNCGDHHGHTCGHGCGGHCH